MDEGKRSTGNEPSGLEPSDSDSRRFHALWLPEVKIVQGVDGEQLKRALDLPNGTSLRIDSQKSVPGWHLPVDQTPRPDDQRPVRESKKVTEEGGLVEPLTQSAPRRGNRLRVQIHGSRRDHDTSRGSIERARGYRPDRVDHAERERDSISPTPWGWRFNRPCGAQR